MIHSTLDTAFIDKVVYINLQKRPDRDRSIREQLTKLAIADEKIIRFEAIEDDPGYLGCARSHQAVLKMLFDKKWENVLILEDDVIFHQDEMHITIANRFFSMLRKTSWDVAMLSANYYKVEPFVTNPNFLKIRAAHCACAYFVNRNYYKILIENVSEAVKKLENGGDQCYCAIDAHWWSLMKNDNWFGLHPAFGYQEAGISDIQNAFVDYKSFFSKSLEDITVGFCCL